MFTKLRIGLRLALEGLLEYLLLRSCGTLSVLHLTWVIWIKSAKIDCGWVDAWREGDIRAWMGVSWVDWTRASGDVGIRYIALHARGQRVNIDGGTRRRVVEAVRRTHRVRMAERRHRLRAEAVWAAMRGRR